MNYFPMEGRNKAFFFRLAMKYQHDLQRSSWSEVTFSLGRWTFSFRVILHFKKTSPHPLRLNREAVLKVSSLPLSVVNKPDTMRMWLIRDQSAWQKDTLNLTPDFSLQNVTEMRGGLSAGGVHVWILQSLSLFVVEFLAVLLPCNLDLAFFRLLSGSNWRAAIKTGVLCEW